MFGGVGSPEIRNLQYLPPSVLDAYKQKMAWVTKMYGFEYGKAEYSEREQRLVDWASCAVCNGVAFETLMQAGITPDYAMGYSMGLDNLCCCLGVFEKDIVYYNLRYCEEEAALAREKNEYFDVATIVGMGQEEVLQCIEKAQIGNAATIGSVNSEVSIMVSGYADAVEKLLEVCLEEGALKAKSLHTGTAFHYAGYQYCKKTKDMLSTIEVKDSPIPIMSAYSQQLLQDGNMLRDETIANFNSSMNWKKSLEALENLGVTQFYDLSPDGMLRKISRLTQSNAKFHAVDKVIKGL